MTDLAGRRRRASAVEFAAGGTILLLWLAALWQSWEFKGLYADGADTLLGMASVQWFSVSLFHPRAHATILSETPVVLAMKLGVRDFRWLARFYSLGLYALPIALYSLALLRARRDAVVLAATIASLAIVFMTTSFHIGAEASPAYASAILAAVWLVTAQRLTIADGLALLAIAALSSRLYEHYVYLGPLLAAMTAWAIARAASRPAMATALYGIVASFFLFGMIIAAWSLIQFNTTDVDRKYLETMIGGVWSFRFNVQLDLLLASAGLILVWGACRPRDFDRPWPYLSAGLPVLLVALSPLLVVAGRFVGPPYSWPQYASRTAAGPITAAAVLFFWLYASRRGTSLPVFAIVKRPRAARYALLLASTMFLAMLPWNAMLTILYARYLDVVRESIRARSGMIEDDQTLLMLHPRLDHHDFAISSLSLVLRSRPTDGIIVLPRDSMSKNTIDPAAPPDLGDFRWRD